MHQYITVTLVQFFIHYTNLLTAPSSFLFIFLFIFFLSGTRPGETPKIYNNKIEILILYHYFAAMWQVCEQPLTDQPEWMSS